MPELRSNESITTASQDEDRPNATESIDRIQSLDLPSDLLKSFLPQLRSLLPQFPDQARVLANVHRFLSCAASGKSWLSRFERESTTLHTLMQLFCTSQYMADMIIADPDVLDALLATDGQPVDQCVLRDEIVAKVSEQNDRKAVMSVLRRIRHRETLRIAYGDFVNGQSIDTVMDQISILATAIVHAAVIAAQRDSASRLRIPVQPDNRPVRFVVLALGKLGGRELNYSSDIDLIFIRESLEPQQAWQQNAAKERATNEYFERLAQRIIKLLSESTADGRAYRVDMRLRPHGRNGSLVVGFHETIGYYDSAGRTWERQAFVKARSIAGDIELGTALLEQLQPWVYRRYLMRADITGIAALKRRIEQRAQRAGDDDRNVKLGHGGIRDIEYVIQFLQLLHGADQPEVRCVNTLEAIGRLQTSGCITAEEQSILETNYRYLRRVEHYLQIMFDRQTHSLPIDANEFAQVAGRIESDMAPGVDASTALRQQLSTRTHQNRQILDHLLHDAFSSYAEDGTAVDCPESDLILDPEPPQEVIVATLRPYGFADCAAAYRHLRELAVESISFLSTRRSRHFLAAITPQLLTAIAATPNPNATLINLANVSASLGGKAVLWELFSANPPSMELCVRLCATSPYLASILTSNPGMIDELLDSLMLDSLPSHEELSRGLEKLCRGAVEISQVLHNFKNSMHLRVGVRDILGKSSIAETHTALSDIAEVCMEQVIHNEFHRLVHQLGMPIRQSNTKAEGPGSSGQAAELVVLAVGKLGGREPNYHSDLDVIFLFDDEGHTQSLVPSRRFESTTNRHFFNQLCQRVIQALTQIGTTGRLYEMDVRLRPLGRSGQLAITINDLERYFAEGGGQAWERQALCKARPIWGSKAARDKAMQCILNILSEGILSNHVSHGKGNRPLTNPVNENFVPQKNPIQQIYDHRIELQRGAAQDNLKRGIGGTMDVEFAVQLLQLTHVRENPSIIQSGTLNAIRHLEKAKILDSETSRALHENYEFLRSIESGIRLMNLSARHELPDRTEELDRLAFLLQSENRVSMNGEQLRDECHKVRQECREILDTTFQEWLPDPDLEQ